MNTRMKSIKKVSIVLLSVISIIAGLVFSPTEKMTAKAGNQFHADYYTYIIQNYPNGCGYLASTNDPNINNFTNMQIDGTPVSGIDMIASSKPNTYYLSMNNCDLASYTTETLHKFTYTYNSTPMTSTFTIHVSQGSGGSGDIGSRNTTSNSVTACEHNYEWTVEKEPTATENGEAVYKCTKCGNISAREPISAYQYYILTSTNKIKDAKAGSTVIVSSKLWNSFPKSFFEEVSKRRDITMKIQFPNDHKYYEITIDPSQTIDLSNIKGDYCGPKYMTGTYNGTEIEEKQMKAY